MRQQDLNLDDMGQHFEVGDWKLLYLLSKNMEPLVFGEFLRELFREMKRDRNPNDTNNDHNGSPNKPLMNAHA